MAIKHAFVSGKSDGGDATLVRPSNWNADHTGGVEQSGWIVASGAWTYASASTITVPSGAASLYQKGDRIRWKQGAGYKYGVLTAVADTLLTILVNTDYTVANAAITDNYYSHELNPMGYPQWFNCVALTYTGIDDGAGGQPTTSEHRARIDGNIYQSHFSIHPNAVKVGTDWYFNWTTPINTVNTTARAIVGVGYILDTADHACIVVTINTASFYCITDDVSIANDTALPQIAVQLSYEI